MTGLVNQTAGNHLLAITRLDDQGPHSLSVMPDCPG